MQIADCTNFVKMRILVVWSFLCLLGCCTGQSELQCCWSDPTVCYHQSMQCDGTDDCPSGEDEQFCGLDYYFEGYDYCCADNLTYCVDAYKECDGVFDCPGGDDEFFCDIPVEQTCVSQAKAFCAEDTTVCLEYDEVCDGKEDCPHASDEFQCSDSCPANCTECARLELICQQYRPWSYDDVTEVQDSMPLVKHITLVGEGNEGNEGVTWSEAIGNDTLHYIRYVTVGTFINLGISSLSPYDFENFEKLILLGISLNNISIIPSQCFQSLELLKELYLIGNNIEGIEAGAFPENIRLLTLMNNRLKVLAPETFAGMFNLTHLNLMNNLISRIDEGTFRDLVSLKELNLENNLITALTAGSLYGLRMLEYIHLTFNNITHLYNTTFRPLENIKYIDLSGNPLWFVEGGIFAYNSHLITLLIQSTELDLRNKQIAQGLENLELIVADDFGICCLLSPATECNTPPSPFATCGGIFRTPLLRASAWIVSICALGGNILVLVMRLRSRHRFSGLNPANIQNRFITNLAVADLLMGLYLFVLAISDARFGSDYFLHSTEWRSGPICKTIGFIGVLSSIASVLILTVITLDRFLCVVFPFGKVHFHSKSAYVTIGMIWSVAVVLSLTPVLLSHRLDGFYGLSDVCLGLPLVTDAKEVTTEWVMSDLSGFEFIYVESEERGGWIYSQLLFIYFNAICVTVIAACYTSMFFSVRQSARLSQRSDTSAQEVKMAAKMALIVGTDMLCWVPIIIMGFISQFSVNIPVVVYAWVVIFVLPINSAVNPFIFTFSSLRRRKRTTTTGMTTSGGDQMNVNTSGMKMGKVKKSANSNSNSGSSSNNI